MVLALEPTVDVPADLVSRANLPGHPSRDVMEVVGGDSRFAGREEMRTGRTDLHLAVFDRAEEPHPILENRPTHCRSDLDEVLERIGRPQAGVSQFLGEVVFLPAIERPADEE